MTFQKMGTLLLTTTFWSVIALSLSIEVQVPCPEEGCSGLVVHIKNISIPKNPMFRRLHQLVDVNNTYNVITLTDQGNLEIQKSESDEGLDVNVHPVIQQRPVPENSGVIFGNDDQRLTTKIQFKENENRSNAYVDWDELSRKKERLEPLNVNLSGKGISGEEVKSILYSRGENVSRTIEHLDLSHNKIRYLPVRTFPVELEYSLLELKIDHNPLLYISSDIQFELSRLASLRKLNLSHINIGRLPDSFTLASLEVLDLSHNRISSLSPKDFGYFPRLREIYLDHNRITVLFSLPTSFSDLSVVSLKDNGLTDIFDDSFEILHGGTVYLNGNQLVDMSKVNAKNSRLYLDGNPWQCHCDLVGMVQSDNPYSTKGPVWSNVMDADNITCVDLSGNARLVSSLTVDDDIIGCRLWDRVDRHAKEAARWLRGYGVTNESVANALGWLLITATVVLVIVQLRHRNKKTPPVLVPFPYNILDGKQEV